MLEVGRQRPGAVRPTAAPTGRPGAVPVPARNLGVVPPVGQLSAGGRPAATFLPVPQLGAGPVQGCPALAFGVGLLGTAAAAAVAFAACPRQFGAGGAAAAGRGRPGTGTPTAAPLQVRPPGQARPHHAVGQGRHGAGCLRFQRRLHCWARWPFSVVWRWSGTLGCDGVGVGSPPGQIGHPLFTGRSASGVRPCIAALPSVFDDGTTRISANARHAVTTFLCLLFQATIAPLHGIKRRLLPLGRHLVAQLFLQEVFLHLFHRLLGALVRLRVGDGSGLLGQGPSLGQALAHARVHCRMTRGYRGGCEHGWRFVQRVGEHVGSGIGAVRAEHLSRGRLVGQQSAGNQFSLKSRLLVD